MNAPNFPLRISYPLDRPYAHIRANAVELVGDRVIITYQDAQELKACLEIHRLVSEAITEYAKVELVVATRELI